MIIVYIFRVKLYINNGWDTEYLIVPESLKDGKEQNSSTGTHDSMIKRYLDYMESLKEDDKSFTDALVGVPYVEDMNIYSYFFEKCDNSQSTARKHRDKGWMFYKSKKVTEVVSNKTKYDGVILVKGEVIASFDKGTVTGKVKKKYPVYVILSKFNSTEIILGGRCRCKCGRGGYCKHITVVLFVIMISQRILAL